MQREALTVMRDFHAPMVEWIAAKLHIEAVLFLLTLSGHHLQKVMMPPSTTLLDSTTSSSSSSSMLADADESLFTTTTKFPVKLHQLLEAAERDPWLSSIISWVRDGHGFLIHDQVIFDRKVMPEIFPTMRAFSSFRRQLNLYGIKKSSLGGM
jgi:HSF-type DNA-binding